MAFREVSVVQVKELLRRWLGGEGERPVAKAVGVARATARGYIAAAVELGVDRAGGVEQLTDGRRRLPAEDPLESLRRLRRVGTARAVRHPHRRGPSWLPQAG